MLFTALSSQAAPPTDTATVVIAGHHLRPGDRFQISAPVEYAIVDVSKAKAPKRSDGARVFEEGMIEFRELGKPAPSADFAVPASGEVAPTTFAVRFTRPLMLVPDRLAMVRVVMTFSQTTKGADGKTKTVQHQQTFPVPLGGDSTANGVSRCLLFSGNPDGGLNVGLYLDCSAR
ncbi:MAG: hypothetical protein JOZ54_07275 [Acidobacteria bacterium]|nr:hypothetical protein [Acidobacteriota bacterium]